MTSSSPRALSVCVLRRRSPRPQGEYRVTRAPQPAEDRRRPGRCGVGAAGADADGAVEVVQPESRRRHAGRLQDRRPHHLRRPQHLLRVPLLRQRARQDPHQRRQARRRVQRRLDRDQPRLRRHRPGGLSPVLESEREPDGCAQHLRVGRAVRRRHGVVQRRQDHRRRLHRRSPDPAADAAVLRRRRGAA